MGRAIIFCLFSLFLFNNIGIAQIPMLDASNVSMPKAKTLNKCIGQDQKVTYTQFECDVTSTLVDESWIEETNMTFLTPIKKDNVSGIPQLNNKPAQTDQSGFGLLKEAMDEKSLMELFDEGLKALMMRQSLLDSL